MGRDLLRPYPATPLYPQLRAEGRLLHDPWWLQPFATRLQMVHGITTNVSGVMTTFTPRRMSARTLAEGTLWVGQQFYRADRTLPRLLANARSPATLFLDAATNWFYAREYRSTVPLGPPLTAAPAPREGAVTGAIVT